MEHIEVERTFPHPIERVFRRYTDHESWTEWAGFGRVWLTREGYPDRNGVGAVRAFASSPGLREEVVRFEPPVDGGDGASSATMEYRIVQGPMPVKDHHGRVSFVREGSGTRITWSASFRSVIPGMGWILQRGITFVFGRMLSGLARDLDRRVA